VIIRLVVWALFWAFLGFGCGEPKRETDKLYDEGMENFRAGLWKEAARQYQRCLQLAPDSTVARVRLGEIYLVTGRKEAAERILEEIPEETRKRPEARVLKARILTLEGHIIEARDLVEEVLEDHPHSVDARLHMARLSLRADFAMDLERARDYGREILRQIPHASEAALIVLIATLRLGEFDQALEFGEPLAQRYPQDASIPLYMGTAALWNQDPAAVPFLQRAVDLSLDDYVDRLKALWLLKLAFAPYPPDFPDRYRFHTFYEIAPSVPVRFTDIAVQAGVDKTDRGRGSAWLDFDQDGDLDLFTVGIRSVHAFYRNDGEGRFEDVAAETGLADPRGGWGASCADYDNDGDRDLYVTRDAWEGGHPNSLFRNDMGRFIDVAPAAGVADSGCNFTAAWGDYDLDGYLDLYVANGVLGDKGKNRLFHNQKDGTFADVAKEAEVADAGKTIGTAFGDYDGDGFPDLYVVNIGQSNRLYHNNGDGSFTDVAAEAGVLFPVVGGYVTFFFDYDNDGTLDLFAATMSGLEGVLNSMVEGHTSQLNRPFLYHNNGDGTFTDVTAAAGLARSFGTMGIGTGDINNDGFPDIYLANGGPEMYRLEPNILFLNRGDGTFADVTETAGVGNLGKGHGVTFADFDGDGDLDLYAGLGGHYDGDIWPNSLYRNDGESGHFLEVETLGTTSNRDGIGARVAVFSGSHQVYAEVASGYGFGSSNPLRLHLGLGERDVADRLEVRWPSGLQQAWEDLPTNCVLRITEGEVDYEIARRGP